MTRAIEVGRAVWRGPVADFLQDETRIIDLEGALRSGKTTAALHKIARSCQRYPGICWLLCRYGDQDTQSKLKPPWRAVLAERGLSYRWHPHEMYDELENGSRAYLFGLKTVEANMRYAKLRGLTLAGIYNDQSEELPYDVFLELIGRLSQSGVPHQILLTPNPTSKVHWLAQEFPEGNPTPGRRYYHLSIYDNAHNLPAETITGLEAAYPLGHPKRRTAIEGLRGLNVIGTPVYKGYFERRLHVAPCTYNPAVPLVEAIDFGKHHPCVVWAQYLPLGGVQFLGGILGMDLFLEDFAPLIAATRAQWFPTIAELKTCCDPAGAHASSQGTKGTGIDILRQHGFHPVWRVNANSPEVRLSMIERLGGQMRRRSTWGETLQVEARSDRWLRATAQGLAHEDFLADGFEAGYVWAEHEVSVGRKQVRTPKKDGWYEHGQNCAEYLELNFGRAQPTDAEKAVEARRELAREKDRAAARGFGPSGRDSWMS